MNKKVFFLILLLSALPAAAQWSANLNFGWVDNVSTDWIKSIDGPAFSEKPFSLWGNGWQAGGGLECRARDWLAWGLSGAYQSFKARPSGQADNAGLTIGWSGESSWQTPVSGYVRLIRPRAIMGTNLKLGLGAMASHLGSLAVSAGGAPAEVMSGTGETVYRPFGQASLGIKIPVTRRWGITLDYGLLMTFDKVVMEMPLEVGLASGW
jgi:hypothetical protein